MLGEQCLQVVLSTDDHDFTDFCYASGWGRARVPGAGEEIAEMGWGGGLGV